MKEVAAYLGLEETDFTMMLCVVPILMLAFFYEHKRQLKKFKKLWKDNLTSSLESLKQSHRKRLDDFKVQPLAMKAEWHSLKSEVERRLEELRALKVQVNSQLATLKLDFQVQATRLASSDETQMRSYVDSKLHPLQKALEDLLSLQERRVQNGHCD